MGKIPDVEFSRWIFSDTVNPDCLYRFAGFKLNYETKNKKTLPIMMFIGTSLPDKETGKAFSGEHRLALFNVSNMKELKKHYGEDTDDWNNKDIDFKIVLEGEKFRLIPVESV